MENGCPLGVNYHPK